MPISFILPLLVTVAGIYLLIKIRFFFILHPIKIAREFISALKNREARRSFFLALAGTLGVGNIFGVSAGLLLGGEGSLFWIFVSSMFSAIIKYAEILLVFDCEEKNGGMAGVISRVFIGLGKYVAPIYALLTVVLSLFMGAAMQTSAVCDISSQTIGVRWPFSAFILVIVLMPAFFGGTRKIEKITEIIIPLTSMIYIIMCLGVILCNFHRLPDIIMRVVSSAILPKSIVGGATALAIKEGFARGILSNEAGAGTSALAHGRSPGRTPHIAGLFGMCEVLFDTTLLCTLTGLVILISVPDITAFSTPMTLVFAAFFASLGEFSKLLLPIIFSFAYATLICWFYYGVEYCRLYFGRLKAVFPFAYVALVMFSQVIPSEFLLYLTDFILLLMTCLTLCAIFKRANRISEISLKNPE